MKHEAHAYGMTAPVTRNGITRVAQNVLIEGVLTTDHAASSYGIPVFVSHRDGEVIGPADNFEISISVDVDHLGEDDGVWSTLAAAARRAGYNVAPRNIDGTDAA